MAKIDLVRQLIFKAGHPNTPRNEAESSALKAAQLIFKHGFQIYPKGEEGDVTDAEGTQEDPHPQPFSRSDDFNVDDFVDVEPFIVDISDVIATCVACMKPIAKGVPYARQGNVTKNHGTATHFDCRRYYLKGSK